jgi:excisionase family DNA binding protein
MEADTRLITAAELALVLNVPTSTVWKWGRRGQVPCVRLPGGRQFVRFDLADVERALQQGEDGNEQNSA